MTKPDCTKCGLCCLSLHDQQGFCDISEKDAKRLGKKFVRLHVLQSSTFDQMAALLDGHSVPWGVIKTTYKLIAKGPFKGVTVCACDQLRGDPSHKVRCAIYAKRPETCRTAMVPGEKACRDLRRMYKKAAEEAADLIEE
jgi:Fe-S-cluster containining protein